MGLSLAMSRQTENQQPNKRSNMGGCGKILRRKKAGIWREGKGRGLVKENVAMETSLRRTLEQSYTNQEDTYGKSILQGNDSSSQPKMGICLRSPRNYRGSHVLEENGAGQISI